MRIDLEQALHDIATSVQDDVGADHLNGRVHHMVGRVRRRRVARYAAQGAVGVGTAAAVAVVGVNVAGNRTPEVAPPATTSPSPGPDDAPADVRRLTCADAAPEPTGTRTGLALELDVPRTVAAGEQVTVTGTMRNVGDAPLHLGGSGTGLEIVAVVDGHVAGTMAGPGTSGGEIPADGRLRPGDTATMTEEGRLAACDDVRTLPEGDFHLVGRTVWEVDGERVVLVTEPIPFTIGDHASDGDVEPYGPDSAGEAAVSSYLAQPLGPEHFPTCGAALPERGDEPLMAELSELGTNQAPWAPGSVLDAILTVRSTDHRTVLGNVDVTAGGSVLLKDGVVVGGVAQPPGREPELLEITAVGEPTAGTVQLVVCGTDHLDDGPLPLPPGAYRLVGTATVALKEILDVDTGSAVSDSRVVTAWSNPVDVVVE